MRIRVEHEPLAESIAALADTAQRIRDHLDELEGEVAELNDAWTGRANEAYARAQRDWTTCADDMRAALVSAATAAARAQARTREAEARVAALWS
ncbi:WXG100 family type VII secretion target [Microbacterium sp. C5A9]|uniref:WXG100 family type VII secretion target n=1 Tax=Microbacterium sp. C5A9 TaxID=2736663 RepID=UPI001F515DC5|nr:WXG100 family type VII secretion target [Microbacterium sp. C5A9]MCI1018623.1 WXG100 family type VII secretion target [Microbacterium sp. C5A9]